jgi:CCR4-NOT transcription complex subunit 2
MSAADRWGLLGLLAMIKNAGVDADGGLSVGTDLGAMGLDMGYEGYVMHYYTTDLFCSCGMEETCIQHL